MVVCFFGYPNDSYSRSKILIDGLKKNRVKVVHCTDKSGFAPIRYFKLFKKFWPLHNKSDIIFVQFPGQLNMPIAWILGKLFSKQVILDAFTSLYNTYIFDRHSVKQASLAAKFYWWVDKLSCTLAHKVTLDTNAHIDYFVKTFKLRRKKFYRLPVGGDDTDFKPRSKVKGQRSKVVVEFHGMFTRLHGAEYFVRVAKKLENYKNLEFWLIGSSHNYKLPINLYKKLKPKSLKYFRRLNVKKLARKVAQADITIGHLGATQKAKMVIGFKLMHGMAVGNAIIAVDKPATKELLVPNTNFLPIKSKSTKSLSDAIIRLSQSKNLLKNLSRNAYQYHKQNFANVILGKSLKKIIERQ